MDARIAEHAARRHGIITLADARRLGATPRQVQRRLEAGRWDSVRRGVYRLAGHPPTWEGHVAVALAVTGPASVSSHRTAMRLWGIDGFGPGTPEVSVPRHHRPARPFGIVHESTDLLLADAVVRNGLRVTGLARSLLDLGAVTPWTRVEEAIDDALRTDRLDWPALYEVLVRHSRQGRDGCGRLRTVLDIRYGDQAIPDSRFERFVARLLVDAGLPMPTMQHPVTDRSGITWRLDLAYPRRRLGIELQSKAHHLNTRSFEQDPRKQNALVAMGWSLLEFTWKRYVDDPEGLCADVRHALNR